MVAIPKEMGLMLMWVPSADDKRGAVVIEAAILLPVILTGLLLIFFVIFQLLFFSLDAADLVDMARLEAAQWVGDRGLYWDVLPPGGLRASPREGSSLQASQLPGLLFSYKGGVFRDISYGNFDLALTYETKIRACLPCYYLRTGHLVEEELLPFLKKLKGAPDNVLPELRGQAYIVDASDKAQDYKQVYHLSPDCQYVRNKNPQVMSVAKAQAAGFRPCVVCLKKQIAKMQ